MQTHQIKDLALLEEQIGSEFETRLLLVEATTHRSFLNESPNHPTKHNERLEFLGDAVLEIIVTEHLFRRFPEENEGRLTCYRSALVNGDTMAEIGETIGLGDFIQMSRGERRSFVGRESRKWILANAMEAIIGALYLDQGMGACRLFIDAHLHRQLTEVISRFNDSKSLLQETAQARYGITPTYKVIAERGPDHAKEFRMAVYLEEKQIGIGEGKSKKEAEVSAAEAACKTLQIDQGLSSGSGKVPAQTSASEKKGK